MSKYADIIELPHHKSRKHPHMSIANRAAQFSPFAALTGHEAAIQETARLTGRKIELEEDQKARLDETLHYLLQQGEQQPEIEVTYFKEDEKKEGGEYVSIIGKVKRVDFANQCLIMRGGNGIKVEEILGIEIF